MADEETPEAPEAERVVLAGADETKAEAFDRIANPEPGEPLFAEPVQAEAAEGDEEEPEE